MSQKSGEVISFKRSHFATRLPTSYVYSPTHWWARPLDGDRWQAGITKFSARMLGDMVDLGVETQPDSPIEPGQIIGWLEGFKAISDIYCIGGGTFLEMNSLLEKNVTLINQKPYAEGWIYSFRGRPDFNCLNAHEYAELLDKTIDKMLEQQKSDSPS